MAVHSIHCFALLAQCFGVRPDLYAAVQAQVNVDHVDQQLEQTEKDNIGTVSFVPTLSEINELIDQSMAAEKAREAGERGPLLSKLYKLPGKFGLCPDSLNPDDTILVKLGRGAIAHSGVVDSAGVLTFINDRNMPLGSSSNGPNAVLANCTNGPYGTLEHPRINLFYESQDKVKGLLKDFINFRSANEKKVFQMFVEKLQLHSASGKSSFKLDPTKPQVLEETLQPHYVKTVSLFQKVATAMEGDSDGSLAKYGLRVNSYCQTWLRNGSPVGEAQFSVMSPHFQTRFFVESAGKLAAAGVTDAEKESYIAILKHFTEVMVKLDYGGKNGQAFVNLDGLHEVLSA